MKIFIWLLLIPLYLSVWPAGAAPKIRLFALFANKAIIMVDDQRRVLITGQESPEGIKLLATDTEKEEAEVEVDGQRRVLALGAVAMKSTQAASAVTLWVQSDGHFYADGRINNQPVRFMVDTGATNIAMNRNQARRLGIDYQSLGKPGVAGTASGVVRVYYIMLRTVQVGEITLHNVDAGVIDGDYPSEMLLGMSFLGRLDMSQQGRKLELTQRY